MTEIAHRSLAELEQGLEYIRRAPKDCGTLALVVRRPAVDQREVLERGELDLALGLVGDTWHLRSSSRTTDGRAHPDMQLNVMNARVVELIAGDRSRWPLAGDQLFVDLDLSVDAMPAGARLAIGTAVIEVTPQPHAGCQKFIDRYGIDAVKFVNSPVGRALRLRGLNARVVQAGVVRQGDLVTRVAGGEA